MEVGLTRRSEQQIPNRTNSHTTVMFRFIGSLLSRCALACRVADTRRPAVGQYVARQPEVRRNHHGSVGSGCPSLSSCPSRTRVQESQELFERREGSLLCGAHLFDDAHERVNPPFSPSIDSDDIGLHDGSTPHMRSRVTRIWLQIGNRWKVGSLVTGKRGAGEKGARLGFLALY